MHQEYQSSNMANTDILLHSILTQHFSINLVIYLVIWLFMVVLCAPFGRLSSFSYQRSDSRRVARDDALATGANVTIPAKGPAYFRHVSRGYAGRSSLHFVL